MKTPLSDHQKEALVNLEYEFLLAINALDNLAQRVCDVSLSLECRSSNDLHILGHDTSHIYRMALAMRDRLEAKLVEIDLPITRGLTSVS